MHKRLPLLPNEVVIGIGLLCWAILTPLGGRAQNAADLILRNGKIVTVDQNFSIAQAVAIRGQRIAAVGTNDEIMRLAGPNTQVLDLKGRTVIPGFVDTHRHMYNAAENDYGGQFTARQLNRYPVDWRGVRNEEDVLNQIQGIMARENPAPGQWLYLANQLAFIRGGTVDQAKIMFDDLTRWDVDRVTPNNPVILSVGIPDFMGVMVNSKAWDILDAKYGDYIRKYGRYWVDAGGRPDGHLEPPASRLALPYSYNRAPEVLGPMYKANMQELNSMGLTTISTRLPQDSLKAYQWLESRGEMTMRLGWGNIEEFGSVYDFQKQMPALGKLINTGTEKIWLTGIGPTAVDGVTTRACTDQKREQAYGVIDSWFPSGQCHYDIEYRGAVNRAAPIQANYYAEWTLAAGRNGVRFANTHVAGDKSHRLIFNLVEQLQRERGKDATKNWAVDHCDMVNPADFKRGAQLGIFFSCYVARSISEGQDKADAYGEKVAHEFLSPVKSLLAAGAKVVFESDSNSYLWDDMEVMITRKDENGKVWGPQERLDRPTALRMITSWAAEYMLRPEQFGTIEAGKFADLQVLDKDYLTIPEEQIHTIQPQLTIFDGKPVFVHTAFAQEYNFRPSGVLVSTYKDLVAKRKPASVRSGGG
ncbi:MAG TPA: amidohydrolase family protein [Terriglobia bacterium]|nr:amidohydrolase family protein [Terriglobia bacterium]